MARSRTRVCRTPRCPHFAGSGGLCPGCSQAREQQRGSSSQRGYGVDYQRARAKALDGATHCCTCGDPFTVDNPATGGHVVAVREGGTVADGIGAECRRCNFGWRRTGS